MGRLGADVCVYAAFYSTSTLLRVCVKERAKHAYTQYWLCLSEQETVLFIVFSLVHRNYIICYSNILKTLTLIPSYPM